ncbi:hypothetical protein [Sphaerisporangium sp. TRM90804]|uniref:hypothetical protein n=1 Tax=Sphaerisporangium sp. TRM90804 TaxID=3031113 RepID=UPI002446B292|nr:hypothetical protein [Sphaerisporangium sp. TRM90804]MDH2424037.1 hypothetical protein [Sphaerisporangium sp. TRM90804]
MTGHPARQGGPHDRHRVNRSTVERVRAALALIVASEHQRRRAEGLMHCWRLNRAGLDEAARALGTPPVSDAEWFAIQDGRGGRR